jgi:F-type H+-transporting ATPase subunit gamma
VIRHAAEFLRAHSAQKIELIVVGRKGRDTLRRRGFEFVSEYLNVSASVDFGKAKEISARIAELYSSGEVDAVYAVYNEFKNVMVQKLRAQKLLPVDPAVLASEAGGLDERSVEGHAGPGSSLPMQPAAAGTGLLVDYIYEQPVAEIFGGLVPRYLDAEVYRILLESAAAEHAARMTAMDSATRNARELIDKLTLQMNKIRQAAITKELIEIVSGATSANS